MPATLDYNDMVRMLLGAAAEIRAHHETLSKLDSVGGDGDHGTTMLRAMACLEKALDHVSEQNIKTLLHEVGWAILGVDGGATGPLLGTLFMKMAEAVLDAETLEAPLVVEMFAAGLEGVLKQTKARPGDKTMIDALEPAVHALRTAADEGQDILEMLRRAADAAHDGAVSTEAMQARFGRARNIKEQSIGSRDPGATSVSLIFRGFWKGMQTNA